MSGNCQRTTVIIKRKAAIGTVPYTYRDIHIRKTVILTRKRQVGPQGKMRSRKRLTGYLF